MGGAGGWISGQLRPTSFHTRRTRTQRYGPGAIVSAKNESHCCPGLSLVPNIPEQPLPSFLSPLPSSLPSFRCSLSPAMSRGARRLTVTGQRRSFSRANGRTCPPSPGGESESAGAGQMLAYRSAADSVRTRVAPATAGKGGNRPDCSRRDRIHAAFPFTSGENSHRASLPSAERTTVAGLQRGCELKQLIFFLK